MSRNAVIAVPPILLGGAVFEELYTTAAIPSQTDRTVSYHRFTLRTLGTQDAAVAGC